MLLGLVAASGAATQAQARRPPTGPVAPRFEVGGGGGFAGGLSLGVRDAALRANSAQPAPYRLFTSDTELRPAAYLEARLGYRFTPRLTAEGRLDFARPRLRASLSGDVENAAAVDAETPLTEYVVDGGALYAFPGSGRRWVPFVSGGAGVARHVYDKRTLVEDGLETYVGGGVTYSRAPTARGAARSGLRADARLQILSGGLTDGSGVVTRLVLSGGVFVAF
jgi:hypothetical protein